MNSDPAPFATPNRCRYHFPPIDKGEEDDANLNCDVRNHLRVQGYFSVGARAGEKYEDCGSSGGNSPFQKVRVVTTIDYDLD